MNNDDASELRVTWEEAQELFRPAPSAEPTVVTVDGYEFEEFEVNLIFGNPHFRFAIVFLVMCFLSPW